MENQHSQSFFMLCDCNNFFVSCERMFNPALEGRAVVVLSNNDGCIIARSNEAKAAGIRMGMPLFEAQPLIDRHRVAVFSSNYQLYGDMSRRVMATLRQHAPSVEVYSIDEAFLDYSGVAPERLATEGRLLAQTVRRNTGIPVSVGVAATKTLAKVASKLCKQYPKLQGCCLMQRPEDIEKVLRRFPIEDVWGIGRRHAQMLAQYQICTAWDFVQAPSEWVQRRMSITGLRTWRELRGESCIEFEHALVDKKSICVSRSFAHEMTDFDSVRRAVATFAAAVGEKLRGQHSCATQLQVFVRTNRHRADRPQTFDTVLVRMDVPTDSTLVLSEAATRALHAIYKEGFGYKKAGVVAFDLVKRGEVQQALFDPIDRSKHSRLMDTIDRINGAQGSMAVHLASQGAVPDFSTRNHVSPRRTTSWDELLEVIV